MSEHHKGRERPSRELIEELCLRFIVNKPVEDTNSFERLLFLIEEAHWYYEDHVLPRNPNLKSLSIREFASMVFDVCPGLDQYKGNLQAILKQFQDFKHTIPVMGGIMLNPAVDKVLLVKGWSKNSAWGFPKGKRMKDETDENCAIREVFEETGYDINGRTNSKDFIEVHAGPQRIKLYIVTDVPEDTCFEPLAQKEIGALAWHLLSELPDSKEESQMVYRNPNGQTHRFYMVHPFLEKLKKWIAQYEAQSPMKEASNQDNGEIVPSTAIATITTSTRNGIVPGEKHFMRFKFDTDAISRCLALR
ncbi:hypothetical protein BSKO_08268 [Bryopsis sp. KO-2023]|nr:hypothetical protein BSKO_08268 [Bryopsis sp. KO-2023]